MSQNISNDKLLVYGQDHSPWVQSVLLALHEQGIPYRLITAPPLSVFVRQGILMPAICKDGNWEWGSTTILESLGYDRPTDTELRAVVDAWQGVVHRADKAVTFFHRASLIHEADSSRSAQLAHQLFRGFAALYFFLLLTFIRQFRLLRDPPDYIAQFLFWNERLPSGSEEFLGGAQPSVVDLMLFGMIQCHFSIPVSATEVLLKEPKLARIRRWIAVMNERFTNYPHLYSGDCSSPTISQPVPADSLERASFWTGVILTSLLLPVSLLLMISIGVRTHYFGKLGPGMQ